MIHNNEADTGEEISEKKQPRRGSAGERENVRRVVELSQNYPNPISLGEGVDPTIHFISESDGFVSVKLYDVLGRCIRTVFEGYAAKGDHSVPLQLSSMRESLKPGMYIYTMTIGERVWSRSMMVIK
jgi:hypothetical protein